MKRMTRHAKSPYLWIGAGFALGAVSMAGVYGGAVVTPAFAQQKPAIGRTISGVSTENMTTLHGLDASYTNLVEFVSPSVVEIAATTSATRRSATGERVPMMGGSGSGFIFRPDGWIITNDHVVGGFDKVTVTLKDGRSFDGKVTRGEDTDIALVKIEAKDLPTLSIADSSKVRPGQMVMAVGAPFGLDQTVTFGHISAIGRLQGIQNRLYPDLIQTDAAINVGNSGGPLVNVDGQVVGVNTAIFSTTGGSAGVGFAIPGNQARFIAEILVNKGKITRSMIGLIPENLKEFQKKERKLTGGALVTEVTSDGPAAAAGIKQDDVIVKIGTTPINSQVDLRNAMLVYSAGTTVPVEFVRNGKRQTVNVKLVAYKRPVDAPAPRTPRDEFPEGEYRFPKEFEDMFKDMPRLRRPNESDGEVPPIRQGQARLGVSIQKITEEFQKQYNIPATTKGVVVTHVEPGSVADKYNIRAGDVISSFDGKAIETPDDLTRAISAIKWGETKRIKTARYGQNGQMSSEQDITFR